MRKLILGIILVAGLLFAAPATAFAAASQQVRPDVDCGWTMSESYTRYTQQETQDVVHGSPYCATYNGNQCYWDTEWGVFDGAPFASLYLYNSDCATNNPEAQNLVNITSDNGNYAVAHGPYGFNTWTQAIASPGPAVDALFQVCMNYTPGIPDQATEGCLDLTYNGT